MTIKDKKASGTKALAKRDLSQISGRKPEALSGTAAFAVVYDEPKARDMAPMNTNLAELAAFEVTCFEDTCKLRDELVVRYVFNFPEACEEFNSLFSGPFEVFNTDLFMQSNAKTQQTVQGLSRFSCRCPFLACAFCIQLEVDSYMYTLPAAVARRQSEPVDRFTPAFTGNVEVAYDPIAGNPYQNATFDHGTISNRIAYYLFNAFGVEADLGCNSYVWRGPFSQTGFVKRSDLRINDSTSIDPTEDLKNCNDQLLRIEEFSADGTQILIANADPCCGDDGVMALSPSPTVEASSGAFDYAGCMGGCVALPKLVLMQGQGLNVTIDVLPGLQRLRDEMLLLCEIRDLNPTNLGDDVVLKRWVAHNLGTTPATAYLHMTGPCGTIVISPGEQIPDGWVNYVLNEDGTLNKVTVRWGHAWRAADDTTYVASDSGSALQAGATITDLDPEKIETNLGPAATVLVRHGKLVLTFSIKGSYLTYTQAMAMIMTYGAVSTNLAEHYLKNAEVAGYMAKFLKKFPETFGLDAKKTAAVGVAGLEQVRDAVREAQQSMSPKTLLKALVEGGIDTASDLV